MKDFLTDEEMQKLEANEMPDFISDEEMAKIEGPQVEPVTMVENEPTPIADMAVALKRGIESAGEAIASPIRKLFTAPPNQDVVVPEELDLGSMQAVRDRQAMLPPSMPAEPGYVPPAGITEGLEAALPIAYQATKKGISGAIQAAAENIPITSFPTEPIAKYMQSVGEGAKAEIEKIIQEKQIRPGTISGVATDVGATVLQFAPILGASIISPALAPYGLGLLATISGGDKYQRAKEAGFTEEQALAQGIAYGIAEVVGEKIGLDALLNAYKSPALRQGIMGFIKETAKQAGIGASEEGVTQIMQNAIDITAKKVNPYTAGETPAITQDVLYAAGVGGIGQGIIGGGMGALQSMMGGKQQTQPQEEQAPPPSESPTATEPPSQNMEATTEFLTRKPAVTFGEAERLRGEEVPTGGMTINRQARPTVTLGGEGERKIAEQPEKTKAIEARPITEVGIKEDTELPPNVWLHGSKREPGTIKNFTVATDSGTMYLTRDWDTARAYADNRPNHIKVVEMNPKAKIFDLNDDAQAENLAKIIREANEDYSDFTGEELQKMNFREAGLSDNREIGNILYDANVDAVLDTNGHADIINDNALKTYNPKGMTIQPTAPTNKLDQLFKREPSKPSPEPQQATEVVAKDMKPQPAEPTAVKTPGIETVEMTAETKQAKPRLAETPEGLITAIKEKAKTGVVGKNGGIEYPAIEVPAVGTFTIEPDGEVYKITHGGISKTKAKPAEAEELFDAIQNDQADVVLKSKWGGAGNLKERESKTTRILHSASGLKWKSLAEVLAEYPDLKVERKAEAKPEIPREVPNILKVGEVKREIPANPPDIENKNIDSITIDEAIKNIDSITIDEAIKNNYIHVDESLEVTQNGNIYRKGYVPVTGWVEDNISFPTPEEALNRYKTVKKRELLESQKKRPKSGPGVFGGAQLQNAYEKGVDMLFKKGKQAYAKNMRNADLTRDMGRVVDITEKDGRPVETEPPIRPRIGMFGAGTIQDIYEKIVGKKQTSNEKITIGDPNIAKEIDDAYDAADKIEMDAKKDAEKMRQTVGGAARQSMIDLFAPYLDLVKKDPARYEQALKKLHDVFYIPSEVEGFLNDYRDQILAPIKKAGKTYRDYSAYRMAKWTLTGRAKVKSKLTLPKAQQFIDSIDPQTRKLFEDITTNFHEKTWKPLLKLLEDAGLKDDKVINFIMDKENYSPFFPAKQMGLSYGSREYKPSGEIFKLTEEGYEGDIQDVLTSLMQKGIAMLTHANINMAKLEGIDILKTMAPKIITKAKKSFKGVKKLKDSNGNEIEVPIIEFDEPSSTSNMALITVRKDGEAEGYHVPKQFAEAFDNALGDPAAFADALRNFSRLTQAIKNVWIDYNPPWQIFVNALRDIPAAVIEMPGFKKPVKFLGKVIKKAPAAVGDYIPFFGDVLQQITGYDRAQFDKQVTQMLKDKKLLSSKDVQHLGDYEITVFDRIQNAFDSFPKDGESQSFLQSMKAFGKDIERLTKVAFDETLEESGEYTPDEIVNMTRRGGSPAFAVRGGGVLNSAIKIPMMFYNAMKEGWRAGKYFAKKDPVGFTIKASVPLGIFAFGAAAAAGAFGDEWKKAYLAIKKSDRENKLVYPLWWTDEGNIKYLALPVPQFLKPFMMIINEFASSNPSLADGFADALSNEMPSLNPILDIGKSLLAYGSNKPPVDRFGNPIMTQDQWTAGGSEKAIAMLKSISNQNLFGSYFKFPIKPSDKRKDWLETFYDASFGKIMKESYAPAIDTEQEDVNAAKARLLKRQIIQIEKTDPEKAQKLREELKALDYHPSRAFNRSVRRELNIEKQQKEGKITEKEAFEKLLRNKPKNQRRSYNKLFKK